MSDHENLEDSAAPESSRVVMDLIAP